MNELEFTFDPSPWQQYLEGLPAGTGASAVQLLTLLEPEDEEEVEQALAYIQNHDLLLDLESLPGSFGTGQTAQRLAQEAAWAKEGLNPAKLDPEDPLALYLQELAQTPAAGDEQALASRFAQGEKGLGSQLTHLGLSRVMALAAAHTGNGVLLLDLIQEGSLGLWQGICQYRTGDYSLWRDRWIRFSMARAIFLQARADGVGRKLRQALEDYRQVDQRLLAELGRNPTLEEISQQLHMSPEEGALVKRMLDNAQLLARTGPAPEQIQTEEEEEQPVEQTAQFQLRQRILDLLSGLSQQDARILTLRFGLESGKPLSPEETGARLGLSPETVLKREAAALSRLREDAGN